MEALVFSHVRYCLPVWGSCSAAQRCHVQKAINFGARIVSGLGRCDHVSKTLRKLGWRTVEEMTVDSDIDSATMRRITSASHGPEVLRDLILARSDASVRRTRAADDGQRQLRRVRTEFARRGFLYLAIKRWSDLSSDARTVPSR